MIDWQPISTYRKGKDGPVLLWLGPPYSRPDVGSWVGGDMRRWMTSGTTDEVLEKGFPRPTHWAEIQAPSMR